MKILLKNAKILTLKNKNIVDGEILVNGNKIAQIAQKINVKADRVIDCEGNLLMPGFKNAHAHSAMVCMRGIGENLSLESWLKNFVFPFEKGYQKNDIYHLNKLAYLEYLESGITAIFEMYYHVDEIIKSSEDFGMRSVTLLTPRNTDIYHLKLKPSKNNLVTPLLGFHSHYTTSEKEIKFIVKLSKELKLPIFSHCSETATECLNRKKVSHLTPVEYLNKLNVFNQGGGIFHGVHLSKNDANILKKHNAYVCTCPVSNLKLASGIAPIKELTKKNITIAIGTDGPASNNSLDMIKEMQLVALLSKYRENNPSSLDAFEVLKMSTVNSAHLMNLKDADVLAKGKLADIIMIDLHAPNMQPQHNIINNLVYNASKANLIMTMIDGKIMYYKHKFYLNEDIKKIYQNANRVIKRLSSKK